MRFLDITLHTAHTLYSSEAHLMDLLPQVDLLIGDYSKAQRKMGWEPRTKFKELIELMVDADLASLKDRLSGRVDKVG